jgi:carbamate kinase
MERINPVICGSLGVKTGRTSDANAAELAKEIGADLFVMATDVPGVYLNWGTPDARLIRETTPWELNINIFPAGSMRPKVEAAYQFVERTGKRAAIGALTDIEAIVAGDLGTQVHPEGHE